MATYTLTAGQIAAHAKTLTASTVDTVTFAADVQGNVRIVNLDGTDRIYITTDGSTPTVGGAATHVLPAAMSVLELDITGASVKLISAGTPTYSVEAI